MITYTKSSYSGGGECVEVALLADGVLLRDSKNINKEPHRFTRHEWQAFIRGVRNGEFGLPAID